RTEVPFRPELERYFGRSLPSIDAYTGSAELGAAGARGAALGQTVVFRDAAPSLSVVAHEVAHVLQQEHAGQVAPGAHHRIAGDGTPAEREADAAAQAITAGPGAAFTVRERPAAVVHLDREDGSPPEAGPARRRSQAAPATGSTPPGAADPAGP